MVRSPVLLVRAGTLEGAEGEELVARVDGRHVAVGGEVGRRILTIDGLVENARVEGLFLLDGRRTGEALAVLALQLELLGCHIGDLRSLLHGRAHVGPHIRRLLSVELHGGHSRLCVGCFGVGAAHASTRGHVSIVALTRGLVGGLIPVVMEVLRNHIGSGVLIGQSYARGNGHEGLVRFLLALLQLLRHKGVLVDGHLWDHPRLGHVRVRLVLAEILLRHFRVCPRDRSVPIEQIVGEGLVSLPRLVVMVQVSLRMLGRRAKAVLEERRVQLVVWNFNQAKGRLAHGVQIDAIIAIAIRLDKRRTVPMGLLVEATRLVARSLLRVRVLGVPVERIEGEASDASLDGGDVVVSADAATTALRRV